MPDVNISINTPVLAAGKTFKVRYRLLPSGAWSAYQTKTNATFTLTGLPDGYYELEVILVNADSSECPPTYKQFHVVTPFSCITFTASIVQTGSLYYLQINYTAPSGNPPCGWTVVYGGNVVQYPTLPAPPLKIQVPNLALYLQVIANNCQLNQRACFQGEIDPVTPAPCTPLVLNTVATTITYLQKLGTQYKFRIDLVFTQSNPCTTAFTLLCNQVNVLAGQPGQVSFLSYSFAPVSCTATGISFEILANPNVQWVMEDIDIQKRKFDFSGKLIDKCGAEHQFSATTTQQ